MSHNKKKKKKIASSCGQTTCTCSILLKSVPLFSTNFLFLCPSVLGNLECHGRKYCCIVKIIWQGKYSSMNTKTFLHQCSLEEVIQNSEEEEKYPTVVQIEGGDISFFL